MNRLNSLYSNMRAVQGILSTKDRGVINSQLDKMINSVRIFYVSKKDFIDNFPDEDDIKGKVRLIVRRRR